MIPITKKNLINAMQAMNIGFALFSENGNIIYHNQCALERCNLTKKTKEITIYDLFENCVFMKSNKKITSKNFNFHLKNDRVYRNNLLLNISKNLDQYLLIEISKFLSEKDETLFVCIISNVSSSTKLEFRLKKEATRDSMTGLYNRKFLELELKKSISLAKRKKSPLSYCLIDIDNFKYINDTFGHDIGDLAILNLAKVLKRYLRIEDTPARLGGDEFSIIFPLITLDEAIISIQRVKEKYAETAILSKGQLVKTPTLSIGVAQLTDNLSLKEIMKNADIALYKSKETKNKISKFID